MSALTGSPVVAINRALAIAAIGDASAALAALPDIAADACSAVNQPCWAALAGLLAKTGDGDQAYAAYETAIGLERHDAVRRFLRERQSRLMR